MNKLIKIFCLLPALAFLFVSCDDWTENEKEEVEHIGGYNTSEEGEAYFQQLREWKATAANYGRPIYFGWFSNWAPSGPVRKGYLASLPDSVDMISMWSNPFDMNEDKIKDKEIFQKIKGGKLVVCYILHNIGTGITPPSVAAKVVQDNPDLSSKELTELTKKAQDAYWGFTSGVKGADDHTAAIQKYAQALIDTIKYHDYDGLDIDWEPRNGGDGDGSLKNNNSIDGGGKYLHVLVEALSKELGPKSQSKDGKYRYLLVDGELNAVNEESGPYFDYYINQTYGVSSKYSLDTRVSRAKFYFGESYDTRKHIFTENFESSSQSGGGLLVQAEYNHEDGPKGGVGAFRLDNDYDNSPDYMWTKQAIQILHESYEKYMKEHSDNNNKTEE